MTPFGSAESRMTESAAVVPLAVSRRLAHTGQGPRGGGIGSLANALFTFAFALIPILMGGWIIATAMGFTSQAIRPGAPVLGLLFIAGFGSIFVIAGFFLVSQGASDLRNAVWRAVLFLRRKKTAAWHRDHPWSKARMSRDIGGPGVSAGAVFIVFFLLYAAVAIVTLLVVIGIGRLGGIGREELKLGAALLLLGMFFLYLSWTAAKDLLPAILHWPRFGRTRVRFPKFPFHPGEVVELTWLPPELGRCERLTFRLRHLRERREWSAGPEGSTASYVPFEYYAGEQVIEMPGPIHRGEPIRVRFDVPGDAPGTALSGSPPMYWELAVTAERPRLRFQARYLIPIYPRSMSASPEKAGRRALAAPGADL